MAEKKEMSVQLLYVGHSPFCQTVAIALAEKGVTFEIIIEDLLNKSPLLLDTNPVHKKVPVLIHNGKPIAESSVIVQYIEDAWSSPLASGGDSFYGDTPYEKAQARFWGAFVYEKLTGVLRKMAGCRDSEIDKTDFERTLLLLNDALTQRAGNEKPFFLGERLSYVDIVFAPFMSWFSSFERFVNLPLASSAQAPRLHEWISALKQHPFIKPVLTDPELVEQKVVGYRSRSSKIKQ